MEVNRIIQKIKEAKEKISENQEFFSEKEKQIIFENIVKKILFEEEEQAFRKPLPIPQKSKEIIVEDSFRSLINKAGISQHKDYILFAAYYLIVKENYEKINVKDINYQYKKAYLKPSTNPSVFLIELTKKGLLMQVGKKDGISAYSITKEGIDYVEGFLKNGSK